MNSRSKAQSYPLPGDDVFEPEWEKFAAEQTITSSYEFEIADRFFRAGFEAGGLAALTHPDDALKGKQGE